MVTVTFVIMLMVLRKPQPRLGSGLEISRMVTIILLVVIGTLVGTNNRKHTNQYIVRHHRPQP